MEALSTVGSSVLLSTQVAAAAVMPQKQTETPRPPQSKSSTEERKPVVKRELPPEQESPEPTFEPASKDLLKTMSQAAKSGIHEPARDAIAEYYQNRKMVTREMEKEPVASKDFESSPPKYHEEESSHEGEYMNRYLNVSRNMETVVAMMGNATTARSESQMRYLAQRSYSA